MTLEELLYQRLTEDLLLGSYLTTYAGKPAVFESMAPEDTSPLWGPAQTPRIEFLITRQEDPERRVSGRVNVAVVCKGESMEAVTKAESRLQALLNGAVFRPDEGLIAIRWESAAPFEDEEDYRGIEVIFDLLAFPSQLTTSPDPIEAMNSWAVMAFGGAIQVDPSSWAPTDSVPAIYWRFAGVQVTDQTAAVSWMEASIVGHVLAPTPTGRLPWVKRITEKLVITRRTVLDDGSPLFFERISSDSQADHLQAGQIRLTARYGILQPEIPSLALNIATAT